MWAANMHHGQHDSTFIQVVHHTPPLMIKTSTEDRSMPIL